jgi:hypothetical protein
MVALDGVAVGDRVFEPLADLAQFPTLAFNSSKKFSTKIRLPAPEASVGLTKTNRWSSAVTS